MSQQFDISTVDTLSQAMPKLKEQWEQHHCRHLDLLQYTATKALKSTWLQSPVLNIAVYASIFAAVIVFIVTFPEQQNSWIGSAVTAAMMFAIMFWNGFVFSHRAPDTEARREASCALSRYCDAATVLQKCVRPGGQSWCGNESECDESEFTKRAHRFLRFIVSNRRKMRAASANFYPYPINDVTRFEHYYIDEITRVYEAFLEFGLVEQGTLQQYLSDKDMVGIPSREQVAQQQETESDESYRIIVLCEASPRVRDLILNRPHPN